MRAKKRILARLSILLNQAEICLLFLTIFCGFKNLPTIKTRFFIIEQQFLQREKNC
jgi:hypothetical protein